MARTLLIVLMAFGAADSVRAGSITIAWDPSPDPTVVGYRVFVGTAAGWYWESFDVGNVTSFSYQAAIDGQRYYFAVASYAQGPGVGPLSNEVAATTGVAFDGSPPGNRSWVWQPGSGTLASRTALCWRPAVSDDCVSVQAVARTTTPVTAMTTTGDGRLFYVDEGRSVRLITPWSVAATPLVVADAGITLNQVVVDPAFAESGFIWVSETVLHADESREFRIARYRVREKTAGERVVVLSGIPLPAAANAVLTIDASRRIYVAVPGQPAGDSHRGTVLRFNADGTAPEHSPADWPILPGIAFPTGIASDLAGGVVWVSGSDHPAAWSVVSIPLDGARLPRVTPSENQSAVSVVYGLDGKYLVSLASNGVLERARVGSPDTLLERQTLNLGSLGRVRAIAADGAGTIYAAVQIDAPFGRSTFAIVRISSRL